MTNPRAQFNNKYVCREDSCKQQIIKSIFTNKIISYNILYFQNQQRETASRRWKDDKNNAGVENIKKLIGTAWQGIV